MREMKASGIEWIGEIPFNWDAVKLGKIGHFTSSGIDKKINIDEPEVKIINYTDVYKNKRLVLDSSFEYMTVTCPKERIAEHLVRIGDLIFTPSSETVEDIGISALVIEELENTAYSYHVLRFRTQKDIYLNYKKYLCNNHYAYNVFSSKATGTIRQTLCRDDFKTLAVFLPPLTEQKAIANYLDRKCDLIDSSIEKQKAVIEKLKLYKQSVITEAVTKGLDKNAKMKPSGVDWIGNIPENWEVCRIKNIVEFNPSYTENFVDGTEVSYAPMEYINQGNIYPIKNAVENVKNGYTYFANDDIVMAKVTPCFENGNIAIAKDLINGVGFGSSELYVFRCVEVNNLFLFYFLQNITFKKICVSTMYGTGGLKRVSSDFVYTYKLALPSRSEQQTIADFLFAKCTEIDKAINNKQKVIDKLTAYKKSLIYECVTGKKEI